VYISSRQEKRLFYYNWKGKQRKRRCARIIFKLKCDLCNETFERGTESFSSKRANNNYKHYCDKCFDFSIVSHIGKANYRKYLDGKIGEKHIDACGYMTIYVANSHPYSNGYCGRVREHILVMENFLERSLKKGEVVHHIDGDKLNNNIENLDLCTVVEHNNCHAKSEEIVFELYKKGVVGYDRAKKLYYLKGEDKNNA